MCHLVGVLTASSLVLSYVYHVYYFDFRWEFFLAHGVRLARLILVFAWCFPSLVFGVKLVGLLENPTFSVSMICRFFGGAMDLARPVQDFVQAGWSHFVAFKWLLLLTRSRAPESGIGRCFVRTFFFVSTLVFIALWLPVAIPDFGCAWVAGASTG